MKGIRCSIAGFLITLALGIPLLPAFGHPYSLFGFLIASSIIWGILVGSNFSRKLFWLLMIVSLCSGIAILGAEIYRFFRMGAWEPISFRDFISFFGLPFTNTVRDWESLYTVSNWLADLSIWYCFPILGFLIFVIGYSTADTKN